MYLSNSHQFLGPFSLHLAGQNQYSLLAFLHLDQRRDLQWEFFLIHVKMLIKHASFTKTFLNYRRSYTFPSFCNPSNGLKYCNWLHNFRCCWTLAKIYLIKSFLWCVWRSYKSKGCILDVVFGGEKNHFNIAAMSGGWYPALSMKSNSDLFSWTNLELSLLSISHKILPFIHDFFWL